MRSLILCRVVPSCRKDLLCSGKPVVYLKALGQQNNHLGCVTAGGTPMSRLENLPGRSVLGSPCLTCFWDHLTPSTQAVNSSHNAHSRLWNPMAYSSVTRCASLCFVWFPPSPTWVPLNLRNRGERRKDLELLLCPVWHNTSLGKTQRHRMMPLLSCSNSDNSHLTQSFSYLLFLSREGLGK